MNMTRNRATLRCIGVLPFVATLPRAASAAAAPDPVWVGAMARVARKSSLPHHASPLTEPGRRRDGATRSWSWTRGLDRSPARLGAGDVPGGGPMLDPSLVPPASGGVSPAHLDNPTRTLHQRPPDRTSLQ